ncbi:MAG: DUF3142 domain-containing protein [bacterium]
MTRLRTNIFAWGIVLTAWALLAGVFWLLPPERKTARLPIALYVWQRDWTRDVTPAVERAGESTDAFLVLAAEMKGGEGGTRLAARMNPSWKTLAKSQKPVIPVLRFDAKSAANVVSSQMTETVRRCGELVRGIAAEAAINNLTLSEFQLDYDCPTSKLADYRSFLMALKTECPDWAFSITVLPSWMESPAFAGLIRETTAYVLQVHSLDKPRTVQDPIILCDTKRIPGYLRRADQLGHPYYLALPTYGYDVFFDEKGRFQGLSAELESAAWNPGTTVKRVMADAEEMAGVIRWLRREPSVYCRGVAWFRLPVDADRLNWPWPALQAVMDGRNPRISFVAETRNPQPNLYEIWVRNTGEQNVAGNIRFSISSIAGNVVAYDVLGDFLEGEPAGQFTGPAPRCGEETLAAWYRVEPDGNPGHTKIAIDTVEVVP